ncbi:hypothetical protein AcV5_006982 [Taiwanofungus camphoratus]|nr:hypothetical protein AcV5_006982 [Antrodia cinnamomea]
MPEQLEEVLTKIRPHTSSSLPHQKAPASLLQALEATFQEQHTEPSSTAYYAALLTALDGVLQAAPTSGPALGDGDILPAVLYLLALIAPHVPPPVIRSHLSTVINLTSPLFPALVAHAPPLRSQLGLYSAIIQALERPQLEAQGLRQSFVFILQLTLDPRPKVRKKAVELVKDVLSAPPLPLLRHPYAQRVADWVNSTLAEVNSGGMPKFKGKKMQTEGSETGIHLLALLRPILSSLPPTSLPPITTSLLVLPRLGNPHLSQSAYSILADLITISVEDPANNVQEQLSDVLKAVLSSTPSKTDTALAPAWTSVLGSAMLAYHSANPEACAAEVGKVWKALWPILESSDASTRKTAARSLDSLVRCFTPGLITVALEERGQDEHKSVIGKIIAQTTKALHSLAFAQSTSELLAVISSLIDGLRWRGGSRNSPTAAELLLLSLITKIGDLRTQRNFEHKEAADATLSAAMRVLGPEVLLRVLPLNLEPTDRQAGHEPRAFLLPLLSHPHPSPLGHFVSYFVPLTERMFDMQQKAETEGRQSEAKVWSVLVDQIWAGLPGYCWCTPDLQQALTPEYSQLLSQLLYNQPELRPAVLKALKVMVDSNVALASGETAKLPDSIPDAISPEAAESNVTFLRSQAESWLAVLFNVYSSIGRDSRGMVGDVISAWASIAGEQEIAKAFLKLVELFKQNLSKSQATHSFNGVNESESITAVTQDLLALVLPHLSTVDSTALFNLCLSSEVLENKDNGVQKRGYKILAKLVEGRKATFDAKAVLHLLEKNIDGLAAAAKKDRFHLLNQVVPTIPPAQLHLLLSIIPEAVLGTKEPSEKARNAAFDLIVTMGRKMSDGGVVKRSMVDGMDEDGAGEATATVEEYMTMVAGGLAGATPHMISATVTAISRLVFEFKDSISPQMQSEIFTTMLVFVSSANREIVKSVLGFVKLAIHTMSAELLRPHLKELVPALLKWSHDHKNHFKAKVGHIFERMIRRFGWENVYSCAGEEDARKVLLNIKKRKDRAKRKRARQGDDEEVEETSTKGASGGNTFEDVLYGSESEIEDSDDEITAARDSRATKSKGDNTGNRLRMDDDEPMDLLQGAAARFTNASFSKRRKPGQDAARFKTDEDTGKMVIDDEADDNDDGLAVTDDAYRDSLTSADGFTRGPNGRVKFIKDTKKRRREQEDADEDVEMADGDALSSSRKNKRRSDVKLGHEFKAKKAGGDIKKGGMEPYAYLSLSQAAKRNGRGSKVGIAGKR